MTAQERHDHFVEQKRLIKEIVYEQMSLAFRIEVLEFRKAMILSAPIPKGISRNSGYAMVGEGGKEIVVTKEGLVLTPSKSLNNPYMQTNPGEANSPAEVNVNVPAEVTPPPAETNVNVNVGTEKPD